MAQARMQAGTVLRNTYRIVRLVGRGGMGEVYEATHERLAGRYAIKILNVDATERPEALARFRREAQITSGLRHPNIVQVVDFDTTDEGWPYLVMEYLDGPELSQLLREGQPVPLARSLSLLGQIAAGLSAAHQQSIVHRDLKPQNVFVLPLAGGAELVKIVDFGISKTLAAASQKLTSESAFLGTPQYMAPEQAIGRSSDVDARADQFALAVIAYEMLTGQRPFAGETAISLVYQIINVEPPLMGAFTAGLPRAVDAAVRRALAKRPEARFASVDELVAAMAAGARAAGLAGAPAALAAAPERVPGGAAPALARTVAFSTTLSGSAAQTHDRRTRRRAAGLVAAGVLAAVALGVGLVALRASRTRVVTTAMSADRHAAAPVASRPVPARAPDVVAPIAVPAAPPSAPPESPPAPEAPTTGAGAAREPAARRRALAGKAATAKGRGPARRAGSTAPDPAPPAAAEPAASDKPGAEPARGARESLVNDL